MLWAAVFCSLVPAVISVQCISSSGKPVDWFIVYKLPKLTKNPDPILKGGYGHFYMDVDNPTWQLSKISMNDSHHAVSYTLQPIYKAGKSNDFMYVMYNDEDPNKKEPAKYGHTKGVLAFDKTSGYWLVHSTPKFPPFQRDGYTWPHSALTNGQSFLCVSYKYSLLNTIAKQIMFNFVQVYDHWAPQSFLSNNPNLDKVIQGSHPGSPPWTSQVILTSMQGSQFTSFAKTGEFHKELYTDWIAPTFKQDLLTETWLSGRGKLPSNCSTAYKVYNIDKVGLPEDITFTRGKDHSKWAVSKDGSWVCIGDINREKAQKHRGGGTVCMQNSQVWNQFKKTVLDYDKCGTN